MGYHGLSLAIPVYNLRLLLDIIRVYLSSYLFKVSNGKRYLNGGTVPPGCISIGGTVSLGCILNGGTVPPECILHGGTVPPGCISNGGTVPPFNLFQKFYFTTFLTIAFMNFGIHGN